MSDPVHTQNAGFIGDFINDSVVADPDSPIVFQTDQFPATGRPGIFS